MNTLNIVYVMLQFFAMFYIQKYMSTFFQEVKTRKSVYILSHFIYPILVSTLYFLWNIPLINLLGNIVALFIITCNYKANILKKIACAVFLYVFMLLVEVGVAVSTGYLGISSLTHGTYAKPSGMIVVSIILFVVSLIFQNVKTIKKNEIVKIEEWIAIITVPIASIYILIHTLDYDDIEQSVAISSVAATLIINVIVFHLYTVLSKTYQEKLDSAMYEQEMTYYFNQCTYMAKNEEKTLRLKHDMKHHLLYLLDCYENNNENFEKEIKKEIANLTKLETSVNTGVSSLDYIISSKREIFQERNIQFICNHYNGDIIFDKLDSYIIFGNLIDNAIENCSANPSKKIIIDLNQDSKYVYIKIKNTINYPVLKYNPQLISKKGTTEHGIGLSSVKSTLKKYKSEISFSEDKYWFTVLIVIDKYEYIH